MKLLGKKKESFGKKGQASQEDYCCAAEQEENLKGQSPART